MIIIPAIIVAALIYWYITQIIKPVNDEISTGREAENPQSELRFASVSDEYPEGSQGFSNN